MAAPTDAKLRAEILSLFQYMQRLREEIASIVNRYDGHTAFESMSDQLDAIVASTADATDTVLESVEGIEQAVAELRAHPEPEKIDQLCNRISESSVRAMEACSFQDLTGQRVSKIVRSVKFIEDRVEALAELWGKDEIERLSGNGPAPDSRVDGGVQLEGPQLPAEAISQDEIDALFS